MNKPRQPAGCRGIKDNTVFGRTFTVALLQGFILLLASLSSAFAQTYPLRASVQLLPPYSVYLSDYSSPTTDRLVLNLLSLDTKEPEVEVRLHLRLENQAGQRLETRAAFRPPAIRLQAGVPLRLTGAELAQYLQPENLDLKGLNRSQFLRSGQLPEGVWQVCVEVREYYRDARLSLPGCASAWLVLNDPPLLNLPEQNAKFRAQEPQQLAFQWTPRHMGSPNAAFSTEYEFSLVEIWPEGRNPNEAMRTQLPLYQTTTNSSMLVYGPGEPALVPGRRYAWRVQARAQTGAESLNLFKNEGYSEVYSFQWGDACLAPLALEAEALPGNRLKLQWQGQSGQTGYTVRYRQAGEGRWYEKTTLNTNLILTELEAASRYEFAVVAQCGSIRGLATATDTLSTLPQEEVIFACGLPLQGFELDPTQLLERLAPGDVLQAGDFKVLVTEASGSGGTFSGVGIISPAWLKQAKLNVVWENVQINQEYRLVSGELKVTGSQLDVVPQELLDVLDALDELDSELEVIAGQLEQLDSLAAAHHGPTQQVQQDKRIDSVWVDSSTGHIYVATEGGTQHRYPPYTDAQGEPQPVYVADSKGQRYVVDAAGQLHNLSQEPVAYRLAFIPAGSQKYGFDSLQYDALAAQYEPLQLGGEMRRIAWKSFTEGQSDAVGVKNAGSSFPDDVKFRKGASPLSTGQASGNRLELTLAAPAAGFEEPLVAYLEKTDSSGTSYEQLLAQLNLVSYPARSYKLYVVPAGNTASAVNATSLSTALNSIYAPAAISWQVSVLEPQNLSGWDANNDQKLDDGETGMLAAYTAEMRSLASEFFDRQAQEEHAFYLFVAPEAASGRSKLGYMPRNRNVGYLFAQGLGSSAQLWVKTIAHELGHGAFRLEHTFGEQPGLREGSTNNLMDYQATGTTLTKSQWDKIHNPEAVYGIFEEDEDGQYIQQLAENAYTDISGDKWQNIYFLSPAGVAIKIPGATKVVFTEDGGVLNFKIGFKTYYGVYIRENQEFLGYLPEEHKALASNGNLQTVEWEQEFRVKEYTSIEYAPVGVSIYAKAKRIVDNRYTNCIYSAEWSNPSVGSNYKGIARPPFIPEDAEMSFVSGDQCVDLVADGVEEGVGRQLYMGLVTKTIQLNRKAELVALVNHLSAEIGDANFYFYGYGLEDFEQYTSFNKEVVNYFLENEIFSQGDLTAHFPYKVDKASDYGLIYSSVDLWPDEIPETYNANSIDYVKWRNDAVHAPYEYTLADLKVRHRHLDSYNFIQVIRTLENQGLAEALATHPAYDQYIAKYGTDAAYIFIAQTASEWSHDLLTAIFLRQLAAEYGVFLMKEVVTQLGKETVRRLIREKGKDFVQGAIIDYGLQAVFSHYIDDIPFSEAASPENINWISVAASGVESTFNYKNIFIELGISSSLGCFTNGWTDAGGFKDSFNVGDCALGIGSVFAGKGIGYGLKYLKRFALYSTEQLRAGLARLNITGQQADEIIKKIKNSADEGSGASTNIAGKFSAEQIENYVAVATKQNDKSKVMLGMWDGGGSSSYIAKAGDNYTYFDFDDKWDEAYNFVNKNDDEIWRINKRFIDDQIAAGKEFWFSHDPFSPKNEQFYAREVNYLIDLNVKEFEKIGDLWKAIW